MMPFSFLGGSLRFVSSVALERSVGPEFVVVVVSSREEEATKKKYNKLESYLL